MPITLLITLVFIGIGWALLIRPQQQRARAQAAMVAALEPGDEVITAGGIHGTLIEVGEDTVRLEVAPDVVLTLARAAIARQAEPTEPTDPPASQPGAPFVEDDVTDWIPPADRGEPS